VTLRVGVLGPVTAWLGGREVSTGQPRQRALLALLASRANRVVSRGELVDAIWGTQAPVTAEGGIYTYVAGLRRVLDPDRKPRDQGTVLLSTGAGYLLRLEPGGLDSVAFENLLARARTDRAEGYLPGAERGLREALGQWRGTALAGVPGPHAEAERHRLTELRVAGATDHADVLLALGRNEEAIPELTTLVAEHPLREHTQAMLMVALYRCGRQAEALRVYSEARAVLGTELGIEPGPELSRVHQRVLDMDPSLSEPPASAAGAVVPAQQAGPPSRTAAAGRRSAARSTAESTGNAGTTVGDEVQRLTVTGLAAGRQVATGQVAGGQIPAQLPLEVAGFTGRHDELARLHTLLPGDAPATVPVALVTGMAGVGKTTLAVRFARQIASRFPDGQLYVNLRGFDPASGPVDPGDALRGFLEALDTNGDRVPESLEAQIGLFRSLVDGKRILVVLDNASSADQVRPLLPASPGSMVVITSRNQLTGLVAAEGAQPLPLDVLGDEEARDLLRQRLRAEVVDGAPAAVGEITKLCGRLPLALSITAARAATQPRLTLPALARELKLTGAHLLEVGAEASTDIWAVFSWSYNQLSDATARVFRLLGTHPGPDVSAQAAASMAGLPVTDTRKALAELTRASLVAEPAPGRYTYHDLLRAFAAELADGIDGADEIAAAERRMVDHYLHSSHNAVHRIYPATLRLALPAPSPDIRPETFRSYEEGRAWMRAEIRVLLASVSHAAAHAPVFDTYCWQLPLLLTPALVRSGRWHDDMGCQRIALAAAQRLDDPRALGHAHSGYAQANAIMGDTGVAREHLDQALAAFETSGDRAALAAVRSRLAMLLEQQGRYTEALQHGREALRLRRAFGNRAAIAHAENVVGWMYAKVGQHEEGLRHCRRALDLATETGSRSLAADILDSLGMITLMMGEHEQALNWYQQALAAFRDNEDARGTFSALSGIGDVHLAVGRPESTRDTWHRAIAGADGLPPSLVGRLREKLAALESGSIAGGVATVVM
jgi:DNA-binding SARP family transcriptional activator/Tfp pilus assembly protein PilF